MSETGELDQAPKRRRGPKGAKEKLMDYLARREHSELELRQKMTATGKYSPEEIETGIDWIKENNWLPDPVELSQRVAQSLHDKSKGYLYIYQYLKRKGLPSVQKDSELEFEKALQFAESRYGDDITNAKIEKLIRQLRSRGFEEDTLRKVYYEKR